MLDKPNISEPHRESKPNSADKCRDDGNFCLPDYDAALAALRIFAHDNIAVPACFPFSGGGMRSQWLDLSDEPTARTFLMRLSTTGNAYFHINPFEINLDHYSETEREAAEGRMSAVMSFGGFKARREDVTAIHWLWTDLDPNGAEDDGVTFRANRAKIAALLADETKLKAMGLPGLPTVTIDSGGGYWGFWKLRIPVPVVGNTVDERIKSADAFSAYNRGIQVAFAETLGNAVKADAVIDACRIARLPGLINQPDADKMARGQVARRACIIDHAPERTYVLGQFRRADGPVGASPAPSKGSVNAMAKSFKPAQRIPGNDAGEKIGWLQDNYPLIGDETLWLISELDYSEDGGRRGSLPKRSDGKTDRSGGYYRVLRAILHCYPDFPRELMTGLLLDPNFSEFNAAIREIRAYKGNPARRRSDREADWEARRQVAKTVLKFEKEKAEEVAAEAILAGQCSDPTAENRPKSADAPTNGAKPIIISTGKPAETARLFIKARYPTLIYHNHDWLVHAGPTYKKLEDGRIDADVSSFLATTWWWVRNPETKKPELVPCAPNPRVISDVVSMIKKDRKVFRDIESLEAPCWIDGGAGKTAPKHILACRNGLYDLEKGELLPHTPNFFTRNALEFDFDKNPAEPKRFMEFLHEVWPDAYAELEEKKLHREAHPGRMQGINNEITLLQEIMGYLLVPDTSQQKIFAFIGRAGGGKGTLTRVICHLVGKSNYAAPQLEDLCETFGLQTLIGKQLAVVTDVQLGRSSDEAAIARQLLRISGEDNVTIRRMREKAWEGRLSTRFLMSMNEMIRFSNIDGLSRRFVPLFFKRTFKDRKDTRLEEKLIAELPGILQWAIIGWRRLNQRGTFILPEGVNEGVQEFKEGGSPELAFLVEDCEFGDQATADALTDKDDLYGAYKLWCAARGHKIKPYTVFFKGVYAASDQIKEYRPRGSSDNPDKDRRRVVKGVKIVRARANADNQVSIPDPTATATLLGPGAVASDLLKLISGLKEDAHQAVVGILHEQLTKLRFKVVS